MKYKQTNTIILNPKLGNLLKYKKLRIVNAIPKNTKNIFK